MEKYVNIVESIVTKKNASLERIKKSPGKDMVNLLSADNRLRKLFRDFIEKTREDKGNISFPKFVELVAVIADAVDD
jgi:hypothetical protein